jgi:hypothetical protein
MEKLMTTHRTWEKRREDIRTRIAKVEGAFAHCAVLDCDQPTMAKAGRGLNKNYCRRHVEHFRRHGSYSKPSYTAGELLPHRRSAQTWLEAHRELPEVVEAVERVRALYWRAGPPEEMFRLTGKTPAQRAKVTWARLREQQIAPLQLLSIWLAVSARHAEDPQPEWRIEYRWVQAGKVLHRMSGGSHKRWARETAAGATEVTELHRYAPSRGTVLRQVGRMLAWASAPLDSAATQRSD